MRTGLGMGAALGRFFFRPKRKTDARAAVASVHDPGRTEAVGQLAGFRQDLYGCLTARRDALFELADALTCRPGRVDSLPGLSLEPEFRRGHGGLYAALTKGRIAADRLRRLLGSTVPAGRAGLVWFAGDVSNWPRPDAACSPARLRIFDRSARSLAGDPVTAGWPYAVLAVCGAGRAGVGADVVDGAGGRGPAGPDGLPHRGHPGPDRAGPGRVRRHRPR
jgi:DDE superfamily endonuclease